MKRVIFLHPKIHNISDMCKYLCIENIGENIQLQWDDYNPEIIIASEYIYKKKDIFKKFAYFYKKEKDDRNVIYVYHGGEIADPDLNIFDYGITYNDRLQERDRVYRIPIIAKRFPGQEFINDISYDDAMTVVKQKKFCNFIYSNPFAPAMRNMLFFEISKYKHVDSLGAYLNNSGLHSTRYAKNWQEISIKQKSNYKFTIACENALFPGGTSEKLLTSLKAHTVPIYWGNPYVSDEFNDNCYVNCHAYNKIDDIIDTISKIDQSDDLWAKMISSPWQTTAQAYRTQRQYNDYIEFFVRLFSWPTKDIIRRPTGAFIDIYKKKFFRYFGLWNFKDYLFLIFKR